MPWKRAVTGAVLVATLLAGPARASLIVHRTREDGANALRMGGHVFTLDKLISLRESNPHWFALHNPRWGWAQRDQRTA